MDNYKVLQIWPAHADHISHYKDSFINDLFTSGDVVVQRKYDGERMLVHFNHDDTYCTSRRVSKRTNRYIENQDKICNLPHLTNLGYTIIDCEFYSDTWSDAVGILHSLPQRALQLQLTTTVKFAVFDCLYFDGLDIRDKTYSERLTYVFKVLQMLHDDCKDLRFHFVEQFKIDNLQQAYIIANDYWSAGYEGIVLKPMKKAYYDKAAMLKIKKIETVDLVVYSYTVGTGKYSNTVGALLLGYYDADSDKIVHCSKVNCGTDKDRLYWKEYLDNHPNEYRVLEVKCQEITDTSLRHPVYVRIRDDKDYKTCTKDTIFKN